VNRRYIQTGGTTHWEFLQLSHVPDPTHEKKPLDDAGEEKAAANLSDRLFDAVRMKAGFVGFTLTQPTFWSETW